MQDFRKLAKALIKKGYSVLPVSKNKQPTLSWFQFQTRMMSDQEVEKYFKNVFGIALVCGVNGLVCFDLDLKYSLDPTLYDQLKKAVPKDLLKKLYVQKTMNGGYHWLFRVDKVEKGNEKFASRHTTSYEKHEVYLEAYKNPKTREKALKIAGNHKSVVLFESRAKGGYFLLNPTPGYEKVYGEKINVLTQGEYEALESVLRSFNEYEVEDKRVKTYNSDEWELSPFEDYNDNGDGLGLLLDNGWEEINTVGKSVRLKRPGQTHASSSALYDTDTNVFNCFSTSTSFDCGKGYNNVGLFMELECDGDGSEAFKKLINLGYGKTK